MLVKYRIVSYDDYENPIEKIKSSVELDDNMCFDDAINYIVESYDKSYLKKQIYVEDLCEKTWLNFFDYDFLFRRMGIDSFHYKWLHNKLKDIDISFNLFSDEITIVIDGPGIGGLIEEVEGIQFIIHSNEKDKHKYNPHVHVKYGNEELFIYIKDGMVLNNASFKNRKKTKIAINYVLEHKKKLLESWNKITNSNLNIDVYFNI